jgi:hypothetical protein
VSLCITEFLFLVLKVVFIDAFFNEGKVSLSKEPSLDFSVYFFPFLKVSYLTIPFKKWLSLVLSIYRASPCSTCFVVLAINSYTSNLSGTLASSINFDLEVDFFS